MYEIVVAAVETIMTILLIFMILYALKLKSGYSYSKLALLILVLSMMASMFNSLTYFIMAKPGFLTTIVAVNVGMLIMTVVIVILLVFASRETRPRQGLNVAFWLAFLFVWNEASMGAFLYALTSGSKLTGPGIIAVSTFGINTYLFIAPMLAEMLFLYMIEKPRSVFSVLTLSVMVMSVFNPLLTSEHWFIVYGIALTAIAMIVFMLFLIFVVSKQQGRMPYRERIASELILVIYILMSAALLVGASNFASEAVSWLAYAVASLFAMGAYFFLCLSPLELRTISSSGQSDRSITFQLLATVFVTSALTFSALAVYTGSLTL